jgi:RNA polymerase sigma-70 factor (ECF subfamily)
MRTANPSSPRAELVRHSYDVCRTRKVTVDEQDGVAKRFEENRKHLRAVAFRMLGSLSEAEDAVQEAWLRLRRSDTSDIANLGGWLTTVVARVCLDMLRARKARPEESDGAHAAESMQDDATSSDPEQESVLADSVGLALLVVLETLTPAERLAFVLHDMFGMPFDEVAPIVGRSLPAAKQLASRARRRVQGARAVPDGEIRKERDLVEAFLLASRSGDFDALVAVLDPDAVVRADKVVVRGASNVAKQALLASRDRTRRAPYYARLALINGAVGLVVAPRGRLSMVLTFEIARESIAAIEVIADSARLSALELGVLDEDWKAVVEE